MQYDSSKIEVLREEISRMLARDIIVLNRAQAVKMAESLYAVTMVNSSIRWHTVEVMPV
ncbi:hypothetical protein [Spongiibacter tropicus]|uniref:hypothetical protein n=1 Tax=Spongiibacter tropicus TaxID=454602 RepID=UPI0025987B91|nr:hypothetical protein [uncultured Spongiibacter sp.]